MRLHSSCFSILSTIFLFNVSPAMAGDTKTYHYEPKLSELSGRVEWHKYLSAQPPYFGEGKDGKGNPAPDVNVLVLIPDQPIDVVGTTFLGPDEDTFDNVAVIEIDPPDLCHVQRYLGRRVKLSGYLSERSTGFEYTDVLLTVTSVIPESH